MTMFAQLLAKVLFMAYYGITALWVSTPQDGACDNWNATLAVHGLPTEPFSQIMWRESRCETWQINEDDPNGGSFGLLQINAIHLEDVKVRPHRWEGVDRCHVNTPDDLLIGWRNICFASYLHKSEGLVPWGVL